MLFNQLRTLRLPDMLTLLGLLCVSFSVYFSFKGFLIIAYILILMQFILDYFDGKLARAVGGGKLGVYSPGSRGRWTVRRHIGWPLDALCADM